MDAFLQGAIIGGIAGGIAAGMLVVQVARVRKKIVKALTSGDTAAARQLIDKRWPAQRKLGATRLLPLINRFTGLGALGELETIKAEADAAQGGGLSVRMQVLQYALLVRKLLGDPAPELVPLMRAQADELEREGGKLLTLVKRQVRVCLALAVAAEGRPMSDEDRQAATKIASQSEHFRTAFHLGLLCDRLARGETDRLAELHGAIERDWPHSAWSRRAGQLLQQAA